MSKNTTDVNTTTDAGTAPVVHEVTPPAPETPTVPAEKTVKIKIPRERKDQEDVFVSVNERTWLIKRGVEVEVPLCVAEVLQNRERMLEHIYEFHETHAE